MRLRAISYTQFEGTPREWVLSGLTLGPINLVVGKNASGKSRTLNIINGLAKILSGRQKPEFTSGTYDTTFEDKGVDLHYFFEMKDKKVIREEFRREGEKLLERGPGGAGRIFHEREKKDLEYQTPETDLAAVARVDKIQHSFLEPLQQWGSGGRHYQFGEAMGRTAIAILGKDGPQPDPTDVNAVIALYRKGVMDFPDVFKQSVQQDMNTVGYEVEDIGVMPPSDVTIQSPFPVQLNPVILFVKERDLPAVTEQTDMSQGMFRALSIIIHLNYAVMESKPSCLIIDDIGEGLDYDRSCLLIDLLRTKSLESSVQLIMSTNDRFVMNKVPLEEWSVLQRQGGHVRMRNYENSRGVFEEFKNTGLSNFSFLEMDFVNEAPTEKELVHE